MVLLINAEVASEQASQENECWRLWFLGPKVCESCDYRNTSSCAGKSLRRIAMLLPKKQYRYYCGARVTC
jgi:hypothetical protein